jgi:hypothetical protein
VLLLESVAHSRKLESSLKNKNQGLELREREELKFRSQGMFLIFEWPTTLGAGEGLFIVPTSKELLRRVLIRLVR